MRFFANFAMRGIYQALVAICGLALIASPFIPIFGFLVGIPSTALFGLVVLRKGGMEATKVLFFATLILIGVGGVMSGNAPLGLVYGLLLWLPILPIALILRELGSLALAMEAAVALGATIVIGFYLIVDSPAALWKGILQNMTQALSANAPEGFDAANLLGAMDPFTHYMTGVIVADLILNLILGLLLARWLQAVLYYPGGFGREFLTLKLHPAMVYAGLICIVIGLVVKEGFVAELSWNICVVFFVLFMLNGMSIVHAILAGEGYWIVILYLALLFLAPWLLPPIALLGISDLWVNWRKYANKS